MLVEGWGGATRWRWAGPCSTSLPEARSFPVGAGGSDPSRPLSSPLFSSVAVIYHFYQLYLLLSFEALIFAPLSSSYCVTLPTPLLFLSHFLPMVVFDLLSLPFIFCHLLLSLSSDPKDWFPPFISHIPSHSCLYSFLFLLDCCLSDVDSAALSLSSSTTSSSISTLLIVSLPSLVSSAALDKQPLAVSRLRPFFFLVLPFFPDAAPSLHRSRRSPGAEIQFRCSSWAFACLQRLRLGGAYPLLSPPASDWSTGAGFPRGSTRFYRGGGCVRRAEDH